MEAAATALLLRVKAAYVKFLFNVYVDSGSPNVIRKLYVEKCGFWNLPDVGEDSLFGVKQKKAANQGEPEVVYTMSLMSDVKFSVQRLCSLAREIGEEMTGLLAENSEKSDEYKERMYFVFEVVIPLLRAYYDEHHQEDFDPDAKMTQELANVILALKLQKLIQQEPRKMLLLDQVLEQMRKFVELPDLGRQIQFDERKQGMVTRSVLNRLWCPYVIWLARQLLIPDPRQPYGSGNRSVAELLSPEGEPELEPLPYTVSLTNYTQRGVHHG